MWAMAEDAWENAVDAKARIDEIRKVEPFGRVSKPVIEHMLERKETRGR